MHVLVLPSWYKTADAPLSGIFFFEQAQALRAAGMEVRVAVPRRISLRRMPARGFAWARSRFELDGGLPTYQWEVGSLPQRIAPRLSVQVWLQGCQRLFRQYVAQHGVPDVVHAHSLLLGGVLAARLRREARFKIVVTEHCTDYAEGTLAPWQLDMANEAAAAADARIAVSPQLGTLLEGLLPAWKGWEWIPNMLSLPGAAVDAPPRSSEPFVFLHVALFAHYKGQSELLEAFARAFAGDPLVRLRIGGDGPLRPQLELRARQLGIEHQVEFLGLLDRESVRREMLHADAFVLSSHFETFGVVVIEAMACGLPVVATRCGGPECIITEENGLLVEPRDVESLANAMIRMREEYPSYNRTQIAQDCAQRFGRDTVIPQIERLYRSLAGPAEELV